MNATWKKGVELIHTGSSYLGFKLLAVSREQFSSSHCEAMVIVEPGSEEMILEILNNAGMNVQEIDNGVE